MLMCYYKNMIKYVFILYAQNRFYNTKVVKFYTWIWKKFKKKQFSVVILRLNVNVGGYEEEWKFLLLK